MQAPTATGPSADGRTFWIWGSIFHRSESGAGTLNKCSKEWSILWSTLSKAVI